MPLHHRLIAVFFIALWTLALCLPLMSRPAHALTVQSVRFGAHSDKTRLVLDLDGPADFRSFVLGDPVRMIVDLPTFQWTAGAIQEAGKAGVTAVRHGNLDSAVSRIVFDMGRPVAIQNAFVLPAGSGKPARLVIDFAPAQGAAFEQAKNIIFGNLGGGGLSNQPLAAVQPPAPSYNDRMAGSMGGGVPVPPEKPQAFMDRKPVIIIDAGHGGVDPGASGAGLNEKDVVLALAKQVRDTLQSSGRYEVHMTRDSDVFIKLADRVKIARAHKGDLFISIHADSVQNHGVHGASIYTLSETASDAQTAKLAARENKADLIAGIDLSVEDQDVANILVDLAMRDTMNQSKFFAGKLVSLFPSHDVSLLERPHRYAGFAVLKAPDIPSVLIEAGFMSNSSEARRLYTPEHRKKFAKALLGGVDAYFDQARKNQRL